VQLYAIFHPNLVIEAWHVYVAYILVTVLITLTCVFANRLLPILQDAGMTLVIGGGFVTIVVLAAMPDKHASSSFVWKDFVNTTGWGNGVAFLTGVLNGAFTIGTVDAITHLAEELPQPERDLPKGVFAQIGLGFLSKSFRDACIDVGVTPTGAFFFGISLFYSITDLDAVINSNGSFPLAAIYHQATGTKGGTFCLLAIVFFSLLICLVGTLLTCGRIWWALARDKATPFPNFFSNVNEELSCPVPATLLCAFLSLCLGAIPLGSTTGFTVLTGSFIILTSASYAIAIAPNVFTGRKYMPKGPFHLGSAGIYVNAAAVVLIIFFDIMYCFRKFSTLFVWGYWLIHVPAFALPTSTETMNYNSVILVGITSLTAVWWFIKGGKKYQAPNVVHRYLQEKA
jgi:choline transport protein